PLCTGSPNPRPFRNLRSTTAPLPAAPPRGGIDATDLEDAPGLARRHAFTRRGAGDRQAGRREPVCQGACGAGSSGDAPASADGAEPQWTRRDRPEHGGELPRSRARAGGCGGVRKALPDLGRAPGGGGERPPDSEPDWPEGEGAHRGKAPDVPPDQGSRVGGAARAAGLAGDGARTGLGADSAMGYPRTPAPA